MSEHYHSWRRFKGDKFYCSGATCYAKKYISELDGKLVSCPVCWKHFIVDSKRVSNSSGSINCPECLGKDPEITLEYQRKVLQDKILEEHRIFFNKHLGFLRKKQSQSRRKEKELIRRQAELAEERTIFELKKETFKHQQERFHALVIKQREMLKRRRLRIETDKMKAFGITDKVKGIDALVQEAIKDMK